MKKKQSKISWKRFLAGGLSAIMVITGVQGLPQLTAAVKAEETTNDVVYFVDCGDYVVNTVCSGDQFGTHNSVTDQAYGKDAATGYTWGIADTVSSPLVNGSPSTGGVSTDHTWPYEFSSAGKDAASKTDTNRYTKNQYESGVAIRYIDYKFELEAGKYRVETYTKDPWGCSKSPSLLLDTAGKTADEITAAFSAGSGTVLTPETAQKQDVTMDQSGTLTVSYRASGSTNLAINVCYIKITDISNEDPNENVEADLNAISFANTTVTGNLTLPAQGSNGSVITWESSNPDILGADGTVYRPEAGSGDATVFLTATATYGGVSESKKFYFTVPALSDWTQISQFELNDVTITDSYYEAAHTSDVEFLKKFDSDRLLSRFRETAGLDTLGKSPYNGWENSYIGGHTMGHYLSACAQEVKATGNQELKEKLDYLVDELKKCQDSLGTGFIFGAQIENSSDVEKQFNIVEGKDSGKTWVPWYTMHKILAGLVDVYKYTGNTEALEVASDLGDWVYNRVSKWDTATQSRVLGIEYGGMNDCLYELYKYTGKEEHIEAAHMFDETALFEKVLKGGSNVLSGKHANTTIPKFLGALNRYSALKAQGDTLTAEDEKYLSYAEAFWTMVVEKHAFITGGVSDMEHFRTDNSLDASRTQCNCESCCAYNMLKISRALYQITGDKKYMDYYEQTLRNAIMGAIDTDNGTTTYFTPMATGYYKYFSQEDPADNQFWCCTGSGMENYTKLGDSIYFNNGSSLIVNQYVASNITWAEKNVKVEQDSDVTASEQAAFTVRAVDTGTAIGMTSLYLRVPDWISGSPSVEVNGQTQTAAASNGYICISRNWQDGDTVTFHYPMKVVAYGLSDNNTVYGFKYGPTVLAAKLGTDKWDTTVWAGANLAAAGYKVVGSESAYLQVTYGATARQILGTETLKTQNTSMTDFIKNIDQYMVKSGTGSTLEFKLTGTDADDNFTDGLTFVPFNTLNDERYGIYWYFEGNNTESSEDKILSDKEEGRFAASIVDSIQPGYGQYETDSIHQMQETDTQAANLSGVGSTRYAKAGGSFTYNMVIHSEKENALLCQFVKEDNGKSIKITVGDTVIAQETLNYDGNDTVYKKYYSIPASELEKAQKLTVSGTDYMVVSVKFESNDSGDSARLASGLYMTTAYGKNASIAEVTSDTGTVSQKGTDITMVVPKSTAQVKASFSIADKQGLLYINDTLVNDAKVQTIALTGEKTVAALKVYGEDHETYQTYSLSIYYEGSEPTEQVTVTYQAGTGGIISGNASQTIAKGQTTTAVTAVANTGYEFSKWSDGVTTAKRTDSNVTESKTVTAQFVKKTVTVTYKAGTGGTISGVTTQKVAYGANADSVTAKAKSGYQFVKWSDGVKTAKRTDISVKADKTVTAQFEKIATKIKLDTKKVTLGVKETYTLTAKVTPSDAAASSKKVTWKTSNAKIVTVSKSGKLTAKKTGTATIKATTASGKSVTCKVTVKKAPSKVTLNATSQTLKKGKTFQIKVTLPKNTASNAITYTSGNKKIVTVSQSGKIKAIKKGKTFVKVKTFNGKTKTIQITVK